MPKAKSTKAKKAKTKTKVKKKTVKKVIIKRKTVKAPNAPNNAFDVGAEYRHTINQLMAQLGQTQRLQLELQNENHELKATKQVAQLRDHYADAEKNAEQVVHLSKELNELKIKYEISCRDREDNFKLKTELEALIATHEKTVAELEKVIVFICSMIERLQVVILFLNVVCHR